MCCFVPFFAQCWVVEEPLKGRRRAVEGSFPGTGVERRYIGVTLPVVVHGVEVGDVEGAEQLEWAAEHLLPQTGVDGEHGVVDMRVAALDVAENGEEELFHLVGCDFYTVGVGFVGFGREIPVVAVAGVEECGAVTQCDDGAYAYVGGTIGGEVEMSRVDTLAEAQHGQRKAYVDTATAHGIIGREQVPVGMDGAPVGDVGIVVVLVEVGNDEINRFALSLFEQSVQHPVGILPIVKDYQAVFLFGDKAGMENEMQLHWFDSVRF